MSYLVDTDVLIDVARQQSGAIEFLEALPEPWSVSVITAMELIVGARNKREVSAIDEMLELLPTVPLRPAIGDTAYDLLKVFAKSHGLRVFDALIASTAILEGQILVTRNTKHFRAIPDLRLEIPGYSV